VLVVFERKHLFAQWLELNGILNNGIHARVPLLKADAQLPITDRGSPHAGPLL
jgi:hypothetical protein